MNDPRVLWLRCGYGQEQPWLNVWRHYELNANAPEATDSWPNKRDPMDQRWQDRVPWALTDDVLVRVRPQFRNRADSDLSWSDLLVIERAEWDAERTAVDVAMFNLQLGRTLVWWPVDGDPRPGDLALVDLSPHGFRDTTRIDAGWWDAQVEEASHFFVDGPVHVLTHPAWRRLPKPERPVIGLCRVGDQPFPVGEQLQMEVDRFVPFPAPLDVGWVRERARSVADPTAVCPQTWADAAATVLLDDLKRHAWDAAVGVSHLAARDEAAFACALSDLRRGHRPRHARYLGTHIDRRTAFARRRSDAELDAPAAYVLRRASGAELDLNTLLAARSAPASSTTSRIHGWTEKAKEYRQVDGQPPGRAIGRVLGVCDADDVVIVSEAAFQVPPGQHGDRPRVLDVVRGVGHPYDTYEVSVTLLRAGHEVVTLRSNSPKTPAAAIFLVPLEDGEWLLPELLDTLRASASSGDTTKHAPLVSRTTLGTDRETYSPQHPSDPGETEETTILVVCDEWLSRNGGISTFNRGLCEALAREGAHVECLVGPDEDARPDSVTLTRVEPLAWVRDPQDALGAALASAEPEELRSVDVIIGHGHITGFAARAIARRHPDAKLVHIVHTDPERVASFKATLESEREVAKGAEKRKNEEANCAAAHVVCGVGPKLRVVAQRLLNATDPANRVVKDVESVVELLPGAADENVVNAPPPDPQVLTLGRLDDVSKGMDLFADVVKDAGARQGRQLSWVLRGIALGVADREQVHALTSSLNAIVRPYTTDGEELASDLRNAAVLCMASREEGFGLVAFEAIVRGVPVLVGRDSGLGLLLERLDRNDRALVDIAVDQERLREAWVSKLVDVLGDLSTAFEEARRRRERVVERCDWQRTAQCLLRAVV